MLFKHLSGISHGLRSLARQVPSECAICHSWPSRRVCDSCAARFGQTGQRCGRCALRVPAGVQVCGACLRSPPQHDTCLAAVDYAYPWTNALKQFKFRGDPGWARALATLMWSTPWVEPTLECAELVLPVPLSVERLRARGFNQSALLARELAHGKTDFRSLLRLHGTPTQSGLPREERLRNLRGAFVVEPSRVGLLRGRRVVLIDDVMTTGATLDAATQALREAGVAHVAAVVLARTGID